MLRRFLLLIISVFIGLTSCSTGTNSTTSSTPNSADTTASIQISTVSTIPAANFTIGENVPVNISNNTDETITLQDTQLAANGKTIAASTVNTYFLTSNCQSIAPHSSCTARAFTNPTFQSYLLNLTYSSSSGKTYQVNQVISFNKLLPVQNGFIYDASQLNSNFSGLTIPFRLATDYSKITVLVNDQPASFSCYKNSYFANTLCSVNIKSSSLQTGSSAINTVKISGYANESNTPIANAILTLTNIQTANIITSGQNVVINPDDGTNPQTIYLINNGLTTATSLTITPSYPITISSNTCGASLSAGASCSFVINVSGSPVSGQSSVAISYSNSQSTQTLYFNVSYLNQTSPALTLTSSGNFSNIAVNSGPIYASVNVTNSGNINLTNLQFSNVNLQESNMFSFATGSSCYNGITLNVGQSCLMILSYQPLVIKSSSVNFIPTASYVGGGGESRTYANSILNIAYSAVSFATFVAVGDFGTTISSTNNPPSTWTDNIDSPIVTGTITNGITVNNGVYVVVNSSYIESSTQNGLFWKRSGSNSFSDSSCGIAYDGTAYYTCGVVGTTFTGCSITGRGCLIKSTDLVTWAGVYQPSQAVYLNNIYYYTNGTNKAYIATIGSTTSSIGMAVSTDGTTFVQPTTGLAAANSNLLSTAFNTTDNTITAWSSTGYNTTTRIESITGTWTANTTVQPGGVNSGVRGAIFQNGIYTVGNNAGNIFTATNVSASGSYTQVYTGTGDKINGITYGNNIYLGASNSITTPGALVNSGGGWAVDSNYPVGATPLSVYFDGSEFWTTGYPGNSFGFLSSPLPSTPGSWMRPGLISLAKNGSTYLAIDKKGNIYATSNLTTWVQESNPSGQILTNIYCAAINLCFAVGKNGTIIKSINGNTWAQLNSGISTTFNGISCQFGTCVAVGGTGSSNSGTVLTSSDYTTWTVRTTSLAAKNLRSVTFFNNQVLTVGESGALFTSFNNGINWVSESSGTGRNLTSIACGNLGCAISGSGGTIIYSATGVSWIIESSGTTIDLQRVTYNGVFVSTGDTGTVRYSTNGITWNAATIPSSTGGAILYGVTGGP